MPKGLKIQEDNVNQAVFSAIISILHILEVLFILRGRLPCAPASEVINMVVFKAESICGLLTYKMIMQKIISRSLLKCSLL